MVQKYNLEVKEILEKQFHIDLKGYATHEVDMFLDMIIEDYESYQNYIEELGTHLQRYEDENRKLNSRISELELKLKFESDKQVSVDQVDLLKRISNLEKEVFKK
ncbi:DivIVA domain-containing protein [Breznakia pachnodae]|uniref:DivIVA domain-containing protein n=1 Tax=Breznakia pachnodae TaxID=265178 RepID=A0ABU0DY91_9FIRM|nr:DivIVA domain-containing protein [Breznakia pachnodae]MDQ0359605.1 DivIVA domain-containing protein [Breznakia pachnodae]